MGFFNQSLTQIRDLFASMTPAARITSALLLGVIVVSLGYLFQGYAGASEELLFNGEVLQPRDADRVESAIAKAGLTVLPRQAGRIVVPRGEKTAYLAAIADAGALPANFDTLLEESLEAGFFESNDKAKARYKAARERQLSMMVSMMDGVEDAKVLYDIREPAAWEKPKITATVSVLPAAGAMLDATRMKVIRAAVAGAIAGLDPKEVTIANRRDGSEFGGGGSEIAAAAFDDPYFQTRTTYEQKMKAAIEDLLRDIRPSVRVQVSAELDETLSAEVQTIKAEGDPTAIRERTDNTDITTTQSENQGQPGPQSSGPNGKPADLAIAKNQSTDLSNTTEREQFIPTVTELRKHTGLVPKQVRASIAVPSEYLVRVWRENTKDAAPDAKPDDPKLLEPIEEQVRMKITNTVTKLLPKEAVTLTGTNVEVTVFQSLTPDPVTPPSMANEGLLWASKNSGSLIMAGLAVVALVMLRSMVKSIPAAEPGLAFAMPALAPEAVRESPAGKPTGRTEAPARNDPNRPRLRLKKGPTLKDDLTELVKEDPDGAAAILRTWIGNAA